MLLGAAGYIKTDRTCQKVREPATGQVVARSMRPNWRRVAFFYGGTFALTHSLAAGYWLAGGSWGSPRSFAVANGS